jgi:three-Cys-motif partner protein
VATGTDAGLLNGPQPQSVYKHAILDQHAIRYATMTASPLTPRRAVLFDGFAGRGRFDNGSAASAEHMMLAAQKAKATTQIDIFLVEKKQANYLKLDEVADEYRARGIEIQTRRGECGDYLREAVAWAKDASLFLFLDPCGSLLPWNVLQPLISARGTWPRTEVLMNFNADLIRRAGGQYKKGLLDLGGVASADKVCGGQWWRDVALKAHLDSGSKNWEAAAEAVAEEYTRRLSDATNMNWVVAPVRRKAHHQPVYHLIFLTHDPHGLWVFGHAASVAREKWLEALGPDEEELAGMLFGGVAEQIAQEHEHAVTVIKDNLRELVADGKPKSVVKYVVNVLGDVYGEAREKAFSQALRDLVKAGEVSFHTKGEKPHKHVIQKA